MLSTARVFAKSADSTWSQQAKLISNGDTAADAFGNSVSLSADGRTAIIGAYGDNDKGAYSGAAYVFIKGEDGTWSQQFKLTAEDGAAGDRFGASVALSADGRTAMIGASGDDDRGTDSGSVYVFSIPSAKASARVAMIQLRR